MWGFVIRAPCHFSTTRKVLLLLGIQTEQTMGASVMVWASAVVLVWGLPLGTLYLAVLLLVAYL